MSSPSQQQLIHYLQTDLGVSEKAIDLALRLQQPLQGPIHILLWQYGLIDIEQLGKAIEWWVNEREDVTSRG